MTDVDIKHFLVVYNLADGKAHVDPFGTDYEAALAAYARAEEDFANRETYDIVLLGADSIETIKRTHSSYFHTEETFESLLPPGVLVG
jgi:hypothetical protein